MKQLKFRVWNPKQSKLEYFDLQNITVRDNLLCQHKHPVQEWTGLYDKNKKPIYEGDRVSFASEQNIYFFGEVVWLEDKASFGVKCKDLTPETFEDMMNQMSEFNDIIEVIGNIYELPCNPDHNDECLVCDCWLRDCPFRKNKD